MNLNRRKFLKGFAYAVALAAIPGSDAIAKIAETEYIPRTLKADWTFEVITDTENLFGLDLEREMTDILTEEIKERLQVAEVTDIQILDYLNGCRNKLL